MDGIGAAGVGTSASKDDHVHPSDTSKASLSGATFTGPILVTEIQFDTTPPTPTNVVGNTYWDEAEQTLSTIMDAAGTTLQHGQEMYVRCVNKTGVSIPDGSVVYIHDAQGNRPTIALAQADDIAKCHIIGVCTETIADNATGYVTTVGIVHGFNTSGYSADGVPIYLSPTVPGGTTSTRPVSPYYVVEIGHNLNTTVNGAIYVHPQPAIAADSTFTANTDAAAPSQKAVKDYLTYAGYNPTVPGSVSKDTTGFSDPSQIVATYDSVTRKITLTGTLSAYWQGSVLPDFTPGWVSPAHPNSYGPWFLYFDGATVDWYDTPWSFDKLQIAYVYYGSFFKLGIRETHGMMSWQAHEEFHRTVGTYLQSGGDISSVVLSSTTAANRRPAVSAPIVHDEDLKSTITALAAGGPYTQMYLSGASTTNIFTGFSDIVQLATNQPKWNEFTGGAWQQTLMTNNSYMTVWMFAVPVTADTESQGFRYIWLQGQSNGTLAEQQALQTTSLNLGDLTSIFTEFVPLAKVIIRYQSANWTIEQVDKITGTRQSSVTAPAGNFLTSVTTNAPITGHGTVADPLDISPYTGSTKGAVPAGAGSTTKFLREDGTWSTPTAALAGHATVAQASASLAAGATGTYSFALKQVAQILKVVTDYPARVRLYSSSAWQTDDLSRAVTVEADPAHGVVLETVHIAGTLTLELMPVPTFVNIVDGTAYLTVTNNDSVSRTITTTFTYLTLEA
jgi:hypothetical protein